MWLVSIEVCLNRDDGVIVPYQMQRLGRKVAVSGRDTTTDSRRNESGKYAIMRSKIHLYWIERTNLNFPDILNL